MHDRTAPEHMAAERAFFDALDHFGFDAAATDEWGLVTEPVPSLRGGSLLFRASHQYDAPYRLPL